MIAALKHANELQGLMDTALTRQVYPAVAGRRDNNAQIPVLGHCSEYCSVVL